MKCINVNVHLFLCFSLETTEHNAMNFKPYTRSFGEINFFVHSNLKQSVYYVKLKTNRIVSTVKPTRCSNVSNYFI